MAGGEVFTPIFSLKNWFHLATDLLRNRPTGMEPAPRRNLDGTRLIARKNDTLTSFLDLRVRNGYRREQRTGIGMLGSFVYFVAVGHLNDFTQVHHGDAVRDVTHNAQV